MNDTLSMDENEPLGHLTHPLFHLLHTGHLFSGSFFQGAAVGQRHDDERRVVIELGVEQGESIGVFLQFSQKAQFAAKKVPIQLGPVLHDLDGHLLTGLDSSGRPYGTEASASQLSVELVVGEFDESETLGSQAQRFPGVHGDTDGFRNRLVVSHRSQGPAS